MATRRRRRTRRLPTAGAKGKHTYYPGKIQDPHSFNMLPDTTDGVEGLEKRTKASLNDLVEHGLRRILGLVVNDELEQKIAAAVEPPERADESTQLSQ